ncbi:MAG: flagellar biosynthetic protein FliR [Magnetococcales bacterium]|nr:flagellar biosynthetic protein FliR [Magnetococcales bacterium]
MDLSAFMDLFGLTTGEIQRLVLILSRLSGMFLSAPFFSRSVGPNRIKAVLLIALTVVIFPLVTPWSGEGKKATMLALGYAAVTEVIIGAIFGMLIHWGLVAVQVAGGLMGFQMGLSMAMVMDPTSGVQEGVLSNLMYMTALMIFLAFNGHHLLLEGIARSFTTLPLGGGLPHSEELLRGSVELLVRMFKLALLVAAPVIGVTKLLYLGMGLINRASPQIQVFFVAMPIAQIVGFVVMGLTMAIFGQVMVRELDAFLTAGLRVMRL